MDGRRTGSVYASVRNPPFVGECSRKGACPRHVLIAHRQARKLVVRGGFAWVETALAVAVLALVVQLLWPSVTRWWNRPTASRQVAAHFDGENRSLDYLIYLPESYDGTETPLLLFLHGSGERGADIEVLKRHGPPAMIDSGKHFPMIVVSPQCPVSTHWQPNSLLEFLDHICREFPIDPDRVFISGYSMGGHGAWELAAAAPDRFAAVVPVCGSGDATTATRLAGLPIWVFHGAKDRVIPLECSTQMVKAIEAAGGDPKVTVYPEEDHGICDLTYGNPELYAWLLRQRRRGDLR